MKTLPPGLEEALSSGATNLCWCWRVTRRDGTQLGFTDHDRDLEFDQTTFEAASGFSASETKESIGLNVDNLEVSGALSSDRLQEADLAAGMYDDAHVEVFRVDWSAPENRVLMRTGSLGEVKRAGTAFSAEVRGLAHYLQQPKGRLYQYTCDADLGDQRCGVDLEAANLRAVGTILEVRSDRLFNADGLDDFESDWFSRGLLTFNDGAAAGQSIEVKAHTHAGGAVTMDLWQPPRGPLVPGQAFTVRAGCDKTIATCNAKFANELNFRGFPHMPGNDFVASVARRGQR